MACFTSAHCGLSGAGRHRGGLPDTEATRRRAYDLYEQALAEKNRTDVTSNRRSAEQDNMEAAKPNAKGVLSPRYREIIARHGRSFAAVNVVLCEDGLYRQSPELMYSRGGFGGPVFMSFPGHATLKAAVAAGVEELLRRWHTPDPSESPGVHAELRDLRNQIESRRRQPTLF